MSPVRRLYAQLLQQAERQGGRLVRPDYDALAELAAGWRVLWPELLETGGGSPVARALVAGLREPAAGGLLTDYARRREHDLLLRQAAIVALGRQAGPAAEDRLLELVDADPPVRRVACREVARLGGEWGLTALRASLTEGHPAALAAAAALARRGEGEALELLLVGLAGGDPVAAEVLGELAAPEAAAGLLALGRAPEAEGRETALVALGELGEPRALPLLVETLEHPEPETRVVAAEAFEALTGIRPPAGPDRATWWLANRSCWPEGRAYAHGRPRTPAHWLETLETTWLTVWQPERLEALLGRFELATGERSGFDAYGLDRLANAAELRRLWRWWDEQRESYPAGGWFRLGAVWSVGGAGP